MTEARIKVAQRRQYNTDGSGKGTPTAYRVIETKNTLVVDVGQRLDKEQVERLIGGGFDVVIVADRGER